MTTNYGDEDYEDEDNCLPSRRYQREHEQHEQHSYVHHSGSASSFLLLFIVIVSGVFFGLILARACGAIGDDQTVGVGVGVNNFVVPVRIPR